MLNQFYQLNSILLISPDRTLYISYSWEARSNALVSELTARFQERDISYKRDKEQIAQRESITKFMDEIGTSNYALIVLSEAYLKSEYCMYELIQIYNDSDKNLIKFLKRTFFIILKGTEIYHAPKRQDYLIFWRAKLDGLTLDSTGKDHVSSVYNLFDEIISGVSRYCIESIDPESCDIKRITIDIQKWIRKVQEPNIEWIKKILKGNITDTEELKAIKLKYPRSNLIELLEIGLVMIRGIEFLNHETSIDLWLRLLEILKGRDELVYKTAFCFIEILRIEYFNKWNVSIPNKLQKYELPKGESGLIVDYLVGLKLSKASHYRIREIYKNY